MQLLVKNNDGNAKHLVGAWKDGLLLDYLGQAIAENVKNLPIDEEYYEVERDYINYLFDLKVELDSRIRKNQTEKNNTGYGRKNFSSCSNENDALDKNQFRKTFAKKQMLREIKIIYENWYVELVQKKLYGSNSFEDSKALLNKFYLYLESHYAKELIAFLKSAPVSLVKADEILFQVRNLVAHIYNLENKLRDNEKQFSKA